MKFRKTTIPPKGRNKYGNYTSASNVTRAVVRTINYGDNTTYDDSDKKVDTEVEKEDNFVLFLSKTSGTFDGSEVVTDSVQVIGYKNMVLADTYVGDISGEGQTIQGVPQGMTVKVKKNGTPETTIEFTVTPEVTSIAGTIKIPCAVYRQSEPNFPLGNDSTAWTSLSGLCNTMWLEYAYSVTFAVEGSQGRQGASVRGPVLYDEQTTVRRWCSGEPSEDYPEDEKFIDVIIKDEKKYVCINSYTGSADDDWSTVSSNWKQADNEYDFIAAGLVLAKNASIDFTTSNALYLRDANGNVTAGAEGGQGISFWAGSDSPSDGEFKVSYDGTMEANKGKFGLLEIGKDNSGRSMLSGKHNFGGEDWTMTMQPYKLNMKGPNGSVQITPDPYSDAVDADGFITVNTNNPNRRAISTDGSIEAGNFTKRFNYHYMFAPFVPVQDMEITFITDTNYFTSDGDKWYWKGMETGQSSFNYPYVKLIGGEWNYVTSLSATDGIPSGIFGTSHTKQNNRIYLVI